MKEIRYLVKLTAHNWRRNTWNDEGRETSIMLYGVDAGRYISEQWRDVKAYKTYKAAERRAEKLRCDRFWKTEVVPVLVEVA